MSAPAAIQGSYADLRFVKGRKVCQIVIEIPIEAGDQFVSIFGAPNPESEIPVAIARLDRAAAPKQIEKPRRPMGELPYAQQAALHCNDKRFQRFLYEEGLAAEPSETAAAWAVRTQCGVDSRADISSNGIAIDNWRKLVDRFDAWKVAA